MIEMTPEKLPISHVFQWMGPLSPFLYTVYPKKYAHGFCFAVLCCGYTLTDFPISIRLTSLALWQSNDCPSASKATLMNMDKYFMWIHYERLHNHNKAKHNKTMCIFLGMYCNLGKTTHLAIWINFETLTYEYVRLLMTSYLHQMKTCYDNTSEWVIKSNSLSRTADTKVHVVRPKELLREKGWLTDVGPQFVITHETCSTCSI